MIFVLFVDFFVFSGDIYVYFLGRNSWDVFVFFGGDGRKFFIGGLKITRFTSFWLETYDKVYDVAYLIILINFDTFKFDWKALIFNTFKNFANMSIDEDEIIIVDDYSYLSNASKVSKNSIFSSL